MEDFDRNDDQYENDGNYRDEIYSVAIRAGKRTYFFDVKSTRRDEFYLTITESKKRFEHNGNFHFEKHKIFLYKEDFEKFIEGLQEVMTFINESQSYEDNEEPVSQQEQYDEEPELTIAGVEKDYTNVDFDEI